MRPGRAVVPSWGYVTPLPTALLIRGLFLFRALLSGQFPSAAGTLLALGDSATTFFMMRDLLMMRYLLSGFLSGLLSGLPSCRWAALLSRASNPLPPLPTIGCTRGRDSLPAQKQYLSSTYDRGSGILWLPIPMGSTYGMARESQACISSAFVLPWVYYLLFCYYHVGAVICL